MDYKDNIAYHVSPTKNRESIVKEGLRVKTRSRSTVGISIFRYS